MSALLKVVIDTSIWIRILLGGRLTLPVLEAWQNGLFQSVSSEPLLAELSEVWQRPRLKKHIEEQDAQDLLEQIRHRSVMVELVTTPPRCRDPQDEPVLATAIDGKADVIVTGDSDMRSDDALREAMATYSVQLWGVDTLLEKVASDGDE
jgi:putative PIN family toxin of toxin-antitoxin system